MKSFEVISLDMFQTLVNIDTRRQQVWQPILMDKYSETLADEYAGLLLNGYYKYRNHFAQSESFTLIQKVYENSFADIFIEKHLDFDCVEANRVLFREHTLAELYEDTAEFLESICGRYKVCIVSDADDAMIPPIHKEYSLPLFTSEQYRSYKNDENNTMFIEMLKYYNVNPGQVLHIGDSVSDVLGAKREGITACWLNRNNLLWEHQVNPDYMIRSLTELNEILI